MRWADPPLMLNPGDAVLPREGLGAQAGTAAPAAGMLPEEQAPSGGRAGHRMDSSMHTRKTNPYRACARAGKRAT